MWYIVGVIVTLIGFVVAYIAYVVRFSDKLQLFLFDSDWKTYEDCVEQGFSGDVLDGLLTAYYHHRIIEVKLDEHVYDCQNCKMLIYALVRLRTLDPTADEEEIEIISVKDEDIPFDYFEANMFDYETVSFFKYRIKKGSGRRRWGSIKTSFKLPTFGKLKPAPSM